MKAADKAKIWNIISELITDYDAIVEIKYEEISIYHPWFKDSNDHTHISLDHEDPLKTFREALKYLEDQKQK